MSVDRQLIVAGFHRSGTSLLAELLHRSGLFLGDDLLGAKDSNPHGHFEDVDVMRLHQDILDVNQVGWHIDALRPLHIGADHWEQMSRIVSERRTRHRLWGFKDPRVCFFLGAWEQLLPDMCVVGIYRDPADSVRSLERRHAGDLVDGFGNPELHRRFWTEPDHGVRMWLAYNEALLAWAGRQPERALIVSLRDLQDGLPVVEALNDAFGVGLEEVPTHAVFDPGVTQSSGVRLPVIDQRIERRIHQVWERLERVAVTPDRETVGAA